ncbi:acetoacetate decarboxylase [Couchioplanes azureus]|uniref:acetoacetate decarboxylase n=1 Tax=Couchioplanes caeruleus TaxID=56438 RepID=UPI001670CFB8|nr:acetoacetate decarboxylase [Couchioplanes caeruleus]GGQ62359.1 acetoacetate decarboxylase [Couchioplanes caeruleus subsp. azureus]
MYPPSPWHLRGQLYLSVFAVPAAQLPGLPAGVRPLTVAGRALVGAAWVVYEPGGTLHYRELLAAVLNRSLRSTVMDIWVDSPESCEGGRVLWAIPKDLAELAIAPPEAAAAGIARATLAPGRRLPLRWPTPLSLVQGRDGELVRTPVRGRATLRPTRMTWQVAPDGPLSYLAGRRPLLSLTMADFRLRFGA